jgi:hypothetical protein
MPQIGAFFMSSVVCIRLLRNFKISSQVMFLLNINPEALGKLVGGVAMLAAIVFVLYILLKDKTGNEYKMRKKNKKNIF